MPVDNTSSEHESSPMDSSSADKATSSGDEQPPVVTSQVAAALENTNIAKDETIRTRNRHHPNMEMRQEGFKSMNSFELAQLFEGSPNASSPKRSILSPSSFATSSGGLPPKQPQLSTTTPPGSAGNNVNGNSNSNAYVPGAIPRPSPLGGPHHQREVSWGIVEDIENSNSFEHNKDANRQRSAGAHHHSNNSLDHTGFTSLLHKRTGSNAIPLEVVSPFETEAEQHILTAIQNRPRADTGTSMSSHVYDAVHDFSIATVESEEHRMSDGESVTRPRVVHPPPVRQQHHNRTESVENTLFDLTNAMAAIHQRDAVDDSAEGDPMSPLLDGPASPRGRLGSADQFVRNVALLAGKGKSTRILTMPVLDENSDVETGLSSDGNQGDGDSAEGDDNHPEDNAADKNPSPPIAKRQKKKGSSLMRQGRRSTVVITDKFRTDVEMWKSFFNPRKKFVIEYLKIILLYLILPAIAVACILFYGVGNPVTSSGASYSWWIIFFAVRQVLTFSLAIALQAIIVDYLALGTRLLITILGPTVTLLIVQAKGWPMTLVLWAIMDFALLYESRFAEHWLFWQELFDIFNEENPGGSIVSGDGYRRALIIAVAVGIAVAIKRFVVGLYLGRQTFRHFGEKLASLMKRMLLVSQVAALARDISRIGTGESLTDKRLTFREETLRGLAFSEDEEDDSKSRPSMVSGNTSQGISTRVIDTNARDPITGSLNSSERMKLMQLLEQWEEPRRVGSYDGEDASISAVLNFRKALTFIQKDYPFSSAFGPAQRRVECIESAQNVYLKLLARTQADVLDFETLALVAIDSQGVLDQVKAKELVRVFRPDRDGQLTMVDFVRSIDAIYREFKLLDASIDNATKIDRAIENVFNLFFYTIMICIILAQLGIDPLALFLSLSSIILAFAFAIGNAASKYFDGILLITVRRPYNIGDRVHFSSPEGEPSFDGQAGWVIENVNLYETTAIWGPTNERCSLSNGSIANSRIVNQARSPQPQLFIRMKIPIDTPYSKILLLKRAVEEFMKARPREWVSLNGFRAERIDASLGWVEYVIVALHRGCWQQVGLVLDSKANLSSYCQEVAKQLGIHYTAPPLPVDLKYRPGDIENATPQSSDLSTSDSGIDETNIEERAQQFRSLALSKHNIRLN